MMESGKIYILLWLWGFLDPRVQGDTPSHIDGTELRMGYGVWFRRMYQVRNSNSAWKHVYILPKLRMPDLTWNINMTVCEEGQTNTKKALQYICQEFNHILRNHINERIKVSRRFDKLLSQTNNMLPDELDTEGRDRRSPFDFIGAGASWLFGLSREQQVLDVLNKVNSLSDIVQQKSAKTDAIQEETLDIKYNK